MTYEEHTELIQQIRTNLEDEGKVSNLLAQLSDDYQETLSNLNDATRTSEELTQANEKLREANLDLFLKVGSKKEEPENKLKEEDEEIKSFDDLFDDKGMLK